MATPGREAGVSKYVAAELLDKLFDLTESYGAVGVEEGAITIGNVVERFQVEWMFE